MMTRRLKCGRKKQKKKRKGKNIDRMFKTQKGRGVWNMSNVLFNPKLAEALAKGMGLKKG